MSRVLVCDPARPDIGIIEETVRALTEGLTVVLPTETQYSLSVRADNDLALKKICAVKRRPDNLKAALFVKDLNMARQMCEISRTAAKLAERFLPGPLTLVAPTKERQNLAAQWFCSGDGLGFRVSSSPVIMAVMDRVPFPITATSANISGDITPAEVSGIRSVLGDGVDLYLDAGPCRGIAPSTVVKVNDEVTILRHGIIPEREIRRALEDLN